MFFVGDSDFAVFDIDALARQAYDALDVVCAWIIGIFKNDDVASCRLLEVVSETINDQKLARSECWVHRCAIYDEWLSDKPANREGDDEGDDDNLYPLFD